MKQRFLIFIVLFLALIVRVWGINFGLPHLHPHTDESLIISQAREILRTGDLNPHFFDYPSLLVYLEAFLLKISKLIYGLLERLAISSPLYLADAYFLGRLVIAILGAVSVWLVYRIGEKLFNRQIALVTAYFFALAFSHIQSSHYVKPDVPMFLFGLISFYFSLRIFEERAHKYYLLAGLFAGLATSTQYTGFIFFIPILMVHLTTSFKKKPDFQGFIESLLKKELIIAGLIGILAFFIITPYAFLAREEFFEGIKYSTQGQLHSPTMSSRYNIASPIWYLLYLFFTGLSPLLFFASAIGFVFFLQHLNRKRVILLVYFLFCFLFLSLSSYRTDRASVPLLLPLTLFAALFVFELANVIKKRVFKARISFGYIALALVLLVSFLAVFRTIAFDYLISQKDTRQLAAEWIEENYPQDQIFFAVGDANHIGFYLINKGFNRVVNLFPLENREIFLYPGETLLIDSVNYHIAENYRSLEEYKKFWENYQVIKKKGKLIKEFSQPLFKAGFFGPDFLELSSTANVYHNPTVEIYEIPKLDLF